MKILALLSLILLASCSSEQRYKGTSRNALRCPDDDGASLHVLRGDCQRVPSFFDAALLHHDYPVDEINYPEPY